MFIHIVIRNNYCSRQRRTNSNAGTTVFAVVALTGTTDSAVVALAGTTDSAAVALAGTEQALCTIPKFNFV